MSSDRSASLVDVLRLLHEVGALARALVEAGVLKPGEKGLQNGLVPYSTGRGSSGPQGLALTLAGESFEAIVEAVVQRLRSDRGSSPWLTRAAAAEYLGVPVSRLEKDRRVPSHAWEGRVMYHRGELDEYLLGFDSTRCGGGCGFRT